MSYFWLVFGLLGQSGYCADAHLRSLPAMQRDVPNVLRPDPLPSTKEAASMSDSGRLPESVFARMTNWVDPHSVACLLSTCDEAGSANSGSRLLQAKDPDGNVRLHPVATVTIAILFAVLFFTGIWVLSQLQGVTLGIAGTLEHRRTERQQAMAQAKKDASISDFEEKMSHDVA
mmetsp:Transcript_17740/g.31042  ORF Transcript_17740/g.31042 Transcript_17740/m.31042 type:complete len:174 (-) Transcript_17740:58-579(-)